MRAPRAFWLAVGLACAGAAGAQEQMSLSQRLEMPAHRELMAVSRGASPAAFETDGCSGGMSLVWTGLADQFPQFEAVHGDLPPWEHCCRKHDLTYHEAGGARTAMDSYVARQKADEALRACVFATGDGDLSLLADTYGLSEDTLRQTYRNISDAMYLAVRVGGAPCSGLSWRWGYGYPGCSVFFGSSDKPRAGDQGAPSREAPGN